MTDLDIPQERDFPAGRFSELKEELMTSIEEEMASDERATVITNRRWRRTGLTAAAAVAGLSLVASLGIGLGGQDRASANTAELTDDGAVMITLREGRHPEDLERRLTELGVPAVVDFLESGFGCDDARSSGWVQNPPADEILTWAPDTPDGEPQLVLYPDQLATGETAVLEFQIDEDPNRADGDPNRISARVNLRRSTSEVGPCVPVADTSIVDAENETAGG